MISVSDSSAQWSRAIYEMATPIVLFSIARCQNGMLSIFPIEFYSYVDAFPLQYVCTVHQYLT